MQFWCHPEKKYQPYLISILRLRRTLMIAVARLGRRLRRIAASVRGLLRSEERLVELASMAYLHRDK